MATGHTTHQKHDSTKGGITPTEQWARVEKIARRFEESLARGEKLSIQDFLSEANPDERFAVLVELIRVDIEYRLKVGEHAIGIGVEEYLGRFPEFREALMPVLPQLLSPQTHASNDTGQAISVGSVSGAEDHVTETLSAAAGTGGRSTKDRVSIPGYEIFEELGRGGMGVVYKARQKTLNRLVALKMILHADHAGAEERARFRREAEAAARLQHPNIVQIFEIGEHGGIPFLAMEYVDGGTLAQKIAGARLGVRQAAELVEVLARTIHGAHQRKIVHRDLKPSNVLMTDRDEPKITDFGLAKRLEGETHQTRSGAILGTPSYMSPEQARGEAHRVDERSDVYSLGVILYELLTGGVPFHGTTTKLLDQILHDEPQSPRSLNDEIPRDLETICLTCLQKDPPRRYASALDFADDLHRFLRHEPIRARMVGRTERLWRWCRRNPLPASLTAAIAASLLIGATLSTYFAVQAAGRAREADKQKGLADERAGEALAQADRADREAARAVQNQRQAEIVSANMAFNRGLSLCEAGEIRHGLLWMARALELTPTDESSGLDHALRANLGSWLLQIPRLRTIFIYPRNLEVTSFALNPDSRVILVGTRLRDASDATPAELRAWDWTTGRLLYRIVSQERAFSALAFSPDGRTIWTVTTPYWTGRKLSEICGWDSTTGKALGGAVSDNTHVNALACSSDGKLLALICEGEKPSPTSRIVRVWTTSPLQPTGATLGQGDLVKCIAFSPDSKYLVTGDENRQARLWDAATGKSIGQAFPHQTAVLAVAFSPDGKTIGTGSEDGAVRLWHAADQKNLGVTLAHDSPVNSLAFSRAGTQIVTGCSGRSVRIWDTATGKSVGEPLALPFEVQIVGFGADSRTISAATHVDVRGWEMEPVLPVIKDAHPLAAVAVSPDGKIILAGSANPNPFGSSAAHLWEAATGKSSSSPLGHPHMVLSAAFSPDGKCFLTGCGWWEPQLFSHGQACLWDTATGKPIGAPIDHAGSVYAVAFSPDGRIFATAAADNTVQLWETATRKRIRTITVTVRPGEQLGILSLAFRRDGKILATGGIDWMVHQWNVATGRPAGPDVRVDSLVLGLAYSPDGRWLLTGSAGHTAQLWDARTGQPTGRKFVHKQWVRAVAISPDGTTVLTGSADNTARLWDMATGKAVGPAIRHPDWVAGAAFTPDGSKVVTVSKDATARVWSVGSPLSGERARVRHWIELCTGHRLDIDGNMQLLENLAWQECRRFLDDAGEPPANIPKN